MSTLTYELIKSFEWLLFTSSISINTGAPAPHVDKQDNSLRPDHQFCLIEKNKRLQSYKHAICNAAWSGW